MEAEQQKIIIRSVDAFGDNIILTGIPRDIHLMYPSQFLIDIRPTKQEFRALWRYNPHITPLSENDHSVNVVTFDFGKEYWLMNERPDHIVNATYKGFSRHLGTIVLPQKFYGDIYFSEKELKLPSLTKSLFGQHIPYWIFNSSLRRENRANTGRTEHITKTWRPDRYDELVEHFKGRILFIQVGDGDPEPRPIPGAINLVNRTDVRSLMLLMKHADGVLCTLTGYMHLSAAVPFHGNSHHRPAVILAGGREPATWFTYPNHQVLHTVGALSCCANGGCMRWRMLPLGDNSGLDQNLCLQPVDVIPRCMEMISVKEVANAINLYYNGGTLSYLTPQEAKLIARSPHTSAINAALSEQRNRLTAIGMQYLENSTVDLHYINLASRGDRRIFMEEHLSHCGFSKDWNIKRIEGIIPNERQKEEYGSDLSMPELGRFLSHRECLKASLEDKHHCTIIEDDVMFSLNSKGNITQILDQIPINEWDILFTEVALPNPEIALKYFLMRKNLSNASKTILPSLRNIGFSGSRCYIINKNSKIKVENILFGAPPYTVPYDIHMRNKIDDGSIKGYFTFPFLTSFSDLAYFSSIQDPELAQKASIFNAFTSLNWIDSDEKKALEILNRSDYPHKGTDGRAIAFSQIIQALVSENFWQ